MLGLDVSKATLAGARIDPQTHRLCWELSVPNTEEGVRVLLQRTPPEEPWVLEPTGPYSTTVARQAVEAGRQVLLAPPREAKRFLQAIQSRAKTDRLDRQGLARYGMVVPLKPYPLKRPQTERVDQLLAARRGLSTSLARLKQQQHALPAAAAVLKAASAALTTQLAALDRQLAEETADATAFPQVAALDAVPGIGPVTAAAAVSCLEEKQFSHPDQFIAYIGLDPRVRQSGAAAGTRHLSKQGHAELRRLLFLCARANLVSRDPANPFKVQYQREVAKGLAPTAALNVMARKLARLCWSLHKHGTSYDPERVHHQPPPTHRRLPAP